MVREAVTAVIVEPYWLRGDLNTSGIMTKQIPRTDFKRYTEYIYWRPDFHLHWENQLDESYFQK